jgi:hypothetical protein
LANIHPTVTAFSMNSWARVCKKTVNPRGCEGARGGCGTCNICSTSASSAYAPLGPAAARQSLTRRPNTLRRTRVSARLFEARDFFRQEIVLGKRLF